MLIICFLRYLRIVSGRRAWDAVAQHPCSLHHRERQCEATVGSTQRYRRHKVVDRPCHRTMRITVCQTIEHGFECILSGKGITCVIGRMCLNRVVSWRQRVKKDAANLHSWSAASLPIEKIGVELNFRTATKRRKRSRRICLLLLTLHTVIPQIPLQ